MRRIAAPPAIGESPVNHRPDPALHNIAPPGSPEARDLAHLLHPTTNLRSHEEKGPLVIDRAHGIHVYTADGRELIEGMAGLWCTSLGYGDEELIEVATAQMRRMSYGHLFGGRSHEPAIALAEQLKAMLPMNAGRVFFANSGSEANDTQVKLVRYYNNAIGQPQRKKVIARTGGYHGVTVASGSLTGLKAFHTSFDLPIPGILHTACPHYTRDAEPGETEREFSARLARELESLILREGPDTVAAFIAEPVLGAGGVVPPPEGYFEAVTAVLARHDVLFIDDEVICGFGRTGNAFGAQTYGFRPDTMTLAKALSSAYAPISAVALPEYMYEAIRDESARRGTFAHGFTYGGHPVAAAVAVRTLEIYAERDLFAHAARVGERMQARLAALAGRPLVGEVRGVGLIGAVELMAEGPARTPFPPALGVGARCAEAAIDAGLIVRNLGDTVAFCPPLIITAAQVDEMFDRFERALAATADWVSRQRAA